jgi:hypothetical protein
VFEWAFWGCTGLFAGCLGGVWETFWKCLGVILGGNWRKKGSYRLFKIALNSLFTDRGVYIYMYRESFLNVVFCQSYEQKTEKLRRLFQCERIPLGS